MNEPVLRIVVTIAISHASLQLPGNLLISVIIAVVWGQHVTIVL